MEKGLKKGHFREVCHGCSKLPVHPVLFCFVLLGGGGEERRRMKLLETSIVNAA